MRRGVGGWRKDGGRGIEVAGWREVDDGWVPLPHDVWVVVGLRYGAHAVTPRWETLGRRRDAPAQARRAKTGTAKAVGVKDRPRLIEKEGKGVVWRPGL